MKVHHCDSCKKAFKKKEMRITLWVKLKQNHRIKPVKLELCYDCYKGLQAIAKNMDNEEFKERDIE